MIWNQSRECISRDELCELQGRQLVQLVEHMYKNAKYYRMKMKLQGIEPGDIRGIEDLDKLPFTTKEDLKKAGYYELFAVPQSEIIRYRTASIVAGLETMVGYTQNDLDIWQECTARIIYMAGLQNNDTLRSLIQGNELWPEQMWKLADQRPDKRYKVMFGLCRLAGSWLAGECEYHCGMHVQEDFFLTEVLDANTLTTVPDNHKGELVITTLGKEAVPLIRYKTTNITSINHKKCECKRTNARIEKFCERTDDMLLIRGNNVYPSYIESVLLNLEDIQARYAVYVKKEDNLDIVEVLVDFDDLGRFSLTGDVEKIKNKIAKAVCSAIGMMPRVILTDKHCISNFGNSKVTIADNRN